MGTQHTDALLRFVRRWFDERTATSVFEPLLADHQREWLDAAPRRRRWVAMRASAVFATTVIASLPRVIATPAPASVTRRVVGRILLSTLGCAALFSIPIVYEIDPLWLRGLLMLFALPASIAFAFPFAMNAAVDAIRCHEKLPPHVERAAALKLAAAGCVVMFILLGWVVPATNQQWRVVMAGDRPSPPKGVRELTIVELVTDPAKATARPLAGHIAAQRDINNRLSMVLLPIAVVWMRWVMLGMPRRRFSPLPLSVITGASIVGFVLLRWSTDAFERALWLQPGTGAWLPLLAIGVAGISMQWWTMRQGARAVS